MAWAPWGCCPWLVLFCGMCILVPPSHTGRAGPAGEQLWPLPSGLRKGWSKGGGPGFLFLSWSSSLSCERRTPGSVLGALQTHIKSGLAPFHSCLLKKR